MASSDKIFDIKFYCDRSLLPVGHAVRRLFLIAPLPSWDISQEWSGSDSRLSLGVGAGLPLEVIVQGHIIGVRAGLPLEIRGHMKAGAGPLCWSGFNSLYSFGDQRTHIVRGEVLLEWF